MPDPRVTALVSSYGANASRLRARVLGLVGALWARLGEYRDRDVDRFVETAVPVVAGGQLAVASLTVAYLAGMQEVLTGRRARIEPTHESEVSTAALRGVDASVVYRRPALELYTALAAGHAFLDAVKLGGQRLQQLAATDLQLAKTHTARRWMEANAGVVGYRRVLTGSTSCGLCVVASTQRYHKQNLLPIHPACDCGVAPIFRDKDPGQIIDPDRLEGTHRAITERFGQADRSAKAATYQNQLVVHEHGEIGPVLAVRGHHFTGPPD